MDNKANEVRKNRFNFFELVHKPSPIELEAYYAEKYYRENQGSYEKTYTAEEISFFNNKIEQKYLALLNVLELSNEVRPSLLDIGAGEGWALKFFQAKSWDVTGIDYGEYGCRTQNPEVRNRLLIREIKGGIRHLMDQERQFDVIWLDNVLEHVLDTLELLISINGLAKEKGVLIIEVPNDFSLLQERLLDSGLIPSPFWVAIPDHINYFNKDGLINLCFEAGWECVDFLSDFPIDFCLLNERTNYVMTNVGKYCHKQRVMLENLLHEISPEKTNKLYRVLADMGLGRNITGFFCKKEAK